MDEACDDIDICWGMDNIDSDGDGWCDDHDDCPLNADPYQNDNDGDDLADACDDPDDDNDGLVDCWNFAVGSYPNTIYFDENDEILSQDDIAAALANGDCGDFALAVDEAIIPDQFELSQNYPNPFNPSTNISYAVAEHGAVSINIYDLTGKLVYDLVNDFHLAGTYNATWDAIDQNGSSVPSGIYIYQLRSNNIIHTKKMLLLR